MSDRRVVTVGPPLTFRHQVARALGADPDSVEWMPTVGAAEAAMAEGTGPPPNVVALSPTVKQQDALGLAEYFGKVSPTTAIVLVRDRDLNGSLPAAMRAGIRDVVDLSKGSDDLREALER